MSKSKGSVIVGDQRATDSGADAVVVPDRGGQGQDALPDAGADPGDAASAVAFQL